MTTNDKALAVRWPMANAPEFASIHVANSTRTTADPGIIWDWLTRPRAVASLLRQRQAHPPPLRPVATTRARQPLLVDHLRGSRDHRDHRVRTA